MAGANISGDLKNPSVAIPKGTLHAIFTSTAVYLLMAFALAATVSRTAASNEGLVNYKLVMASITIWKPIFYVGVFAATLSSALASFVGAPRILQRLCDDNLFPWLRFMGTGHGKKNEPHRAYLLTFAIALGSIMVNNLDLVAPVISNFFLISYGAINYACFATSMTGSPGWRPSFRLYNRWLALLATVLCVVIMFMMDWFNAALSVVVCLVVFGYIHWRPPNVNWGDAAQANLYATALQSALKLDRTELHVKNYRPQCLVLVGKLGKRPHLLRFAHQLAAAKGIVVVGNVIVKADEDRQINLLVHERERGREFLDERNITAFYDATTSTTFPRGARHLMLTSGLGRLRPDTVVMGYPTRWPSDSAKGERFITVLREACALNKGVVIIENFDLDVKPSAVPNPDTASMLKRLQGDAAITVRSIANLRDVIKTEAGDGPVAKFTKAARHHRGTIDVYWLADDGGLTVLLPHLLSKNPAWSSCKLRVFTTANEDNAKEHKARMERLMSDFRMKAEVVVIPEGFLTHGMPDSIEERIEMQQTVHAADAKHTISAYSHIQSLFTVHASSITMHPSMSMAGHASKPSLSTVPNLTEVFDRWELEAGQAEEVDVIVAEAGLQTETEGESTGADSDSASDVSPPIPGPTPAPAPVSLDGLTAESVSVLEDIPIPPVLRDKTLRFVRLGRVIREMSGDAELTVVSTPVPKLDVPVNVLMAWMQQLIREGKPSMLMRGNGTTTLTYDA
ncbi:Amino acid permease [Carpediemonas membranifera]|uniref:Amino acid permease n=1 Tax=Carpediemonas membranifera TaxID=201153 RepID=A0A8J6C0B5_9EUKA|nr:Amino acid permease [Carpediemonas membranifera]|eukprot:KAG9396411.1 Amino acid permease [Carpediemonas membranifera]